MHTTSTFARQITAAVSTLVLATACSQLGGLGSVLGGAAQQPQASQISGTVQSVDTRNQQIVLQATNASPSRSTSTNRPRSAIKIAPTR